MRPLKHVNLVKNTITDGVVPQPTQKLKVKDWTDWILLRKLVLAVLIINLVKLERQLVVDLRYLP